MTTPPWKFSLEPARDKPTLRRQLQAERLAMTDRHQRSVHLQEVLRVWLVSRPETSIGAYWPIKGEFDAMPALFRWSEGEGGYGRLIGLPVIDDAYGIPKPKGTDAFEPEMLLVPCVGFGEGGVRLGYGGGFYDRTLAALEPRPFTVGIGYAHGYVPWLEAEPHDIPLDAMITEDGVFWQRE